MVKKSFKIGIAAAIAIVVAGVSVYAVNVSAGESISEAEAKQVALSEVVGADISNISKFNKDKDDGREEYDVEIIYDGYEYDFEISAKDGQIFDQSKEKADFADIARLEAKNNAQKEAEKKAEQPVQKEPVVVEQERASSESSSSSEISLEKAKSIALAQVSGASSGDVVKAYKDYDDGRVEYDVEVRYDGYEYDFEIDGASGKILSKDIDRIDYEDRYDYD